MGAEINLIKIEGKPLEKLIDVISKGIGKLYEPKSIRKEADARAYELEVLERARVKALVNTQEIEQDLLDRIEERIIHREINKQKNLDSVNSFAAQELQNESEVSSEPLDDDWISRFFSIAEDISNEEMQILWGKILAGEIKAPKTYSLRTLELIRNLSKDEAQIFMKVANFALSVRNDKLIYKGGDELLEKYKITFDDIALLTELGLLQPGEFFSYDLKQTPSANRSFFINGNIIIFLLKNENTPTVSIPIYLFTKIGREILALMEIKPNMDYLRDFARFLKKENISVNYAYILERKDNQYRHTNPPQEFPE